VEPQEKSKVVQLLTREIIRSIKKTVEVALPTRSDIGSGWVEFTMIQTRPDIN